MDDSLIKKLGGRKLLVAIGIVATGIGIVIWKGDIPANLLHLLEVVFGGFVAGNVGASIAASIKPREATPAEAEETQAPPPQPGIEECRAQLQRIEEGVATTQQTLLAIIQAYTPPKR